MPALDGRGPVARVDEICGSLPPGHEWDEREAALLALARSQAADIELLEADISERGSRVQGARGEILNQSLGEVRQARVALARLLGQVDIPDSLAPSSLHGRKAAQARWKGTG